MPSIPFNKPSFVGKELYYISQAIEHWHVSGDGHFTQKCHEMLQAATGAQKVLLTTSCTHALEMAAFLLDIQPGDEVIIPSFTFVSTVNAFVLRGAKPVFADIRPDTLNLDERQLESLITPNTRAIVPVHYAGVGCEMNKIMAIARKMNIAVVEDNAHGLFGKYRKKSLGSFGELATLSFHETKNFFCGEGGALLINDPKHIERAEVLREKGTNRSQFFRGQVDKYTWVDVGSSYLPSDMLAAFLYAQLEQWKKIQRRRKEIWHFYYENLGEWATEHGVQMPMVPAHCDQAYHMFYLLLPDLETRTRFIEHLKNRGVNAVFHYVPLHTSPMGRRLTGNNSFCPVTEETSDRLVRLPFFNGLRESQLIHIIFAVREFEFLRQIKRSAKKELKPQIV